MKASNQHMTEVKFDWESGIEEVCVQLKGKKRIGIQIPEGLKTKAQQILSKVEELYRWRFGESIPVIRNNYETADMIKYMNNCYFATKVSFMNEMHQIAKKSNGDWDDAVRGFVSDGRIGHSHLGVPGHDGKYGFGGSCFPKDIQAMIDFAEPIGIAPTVLYGVWE